MQKNRVSLLSPLILILILVASLSSIIQVEGSLSTKPGLSQMNNPTAARVRASLSSSSLRIPDGTPPPYRAAVPFVRPRMLSLISTPGADQIKTGADDNWYKTPSPPATPAPAVGGVFTSISTSITNVFHHLVFPVQTISDALLEIFKSALNKEQHATMDQESIWINAFYSLFQAPAAGVYAQIASGSLKIAAALAAALFILRLAIYNWNRLLGEEDTPLRVIGDWLTAGVLALIAGPLLDLINRMGWWIMGAVIGNAANLAISFSQGLLDTSLDSSLSNTTFIGPIIMIALMVASMLAVIGIIVAFASGHSVMYVLAVIGPVCMIVGVLPPMRWLRGMWLKGTVVVALLPIVAASIFKAGIEAVAHLEGGVGQEIFRVLWLFGITGFLLSLSGILSRFTIGAAGETLGKLAHLGRAIIEKGVIAGSVIASGGSSAAGAAAGAGAGPGFGGGGGAPLGGATASSPSEAAAIGGFSSSKIQNTPGLPEDGKIASGAGVDNIAGRYQSTSHPEQLSARQLSLDERMNARTEQNTQPPDKPDVTLMASESSAAFGYTPAVNGRLSEIFPGPEGADSFQTGLNGVAKHIQNPNISLNDLVMRHPEEMGLLARAYLDHRMLIDNSRTPLWTAARLGGASTDFVDGVLGGL